MKHRQEETATPFELCCGVYQPQISPITAGKEGTGSPALQNDRGWKLPSFKDLIHQNNGVSWHRSEERTMALVAGDVLHNRNLALARLYGRPV